MDETEKLKLSPAAAKIFLSLREVIKGEKLKLGIIPLISLSCNASGNTS